MSFPVTSSPNQLLQVSMGHVLHLPYTVVVLEERGTLRILGFRSTSYRFHGLLGVFLSQEVLQSLVEANVSLLALGDRGAYLDELPSHFSDRWLCLVGHDLPECPRVRIRMAVDLGVVVSGSILLNGLAERSKRSQQNDGRLPYSNSYIAVYNLHNAI